MTAVYLFAGLLALLVVVGLVVSPLLEGEPVAEEGASAADRRDAEIETLREVEFEYRTGKLSEEDYRELRERHAEAAVRARREAEREAESEPAHRPHCPGCGADARTGARFCSRCGTALEDPGSDTGSGNG